MSSESESPDVAPLELSDALWESYETTGDASDLDRAIAVLTKTTVSSLQHPNLLYESLTNLGVALLSRYRRSSQPSDLRQATHVLRQVVENAPEDKTVTRTRAFSNLALALHSQSESEGHKAGTDEAIRVLRYGLELSRADGRVRGELLANLGVILLRRWLSDRNNTDLEESVFCLRGAAASIPEGPERVTTMSNLADALWSLRGSESLSARDARSRTASSAEAVAIYEEVLTARRKALGADHPDTLASMNNLASALYEQGSLNRAREIFEDVVSIANRALDDKDPIAAYATSNLAAALFAQGDRYRSRLLLADAIDKCERAFGPESALTLAEVEKLGLAASREDKQLSQNLLEHVAATRQRLLGADHPDTVAATRNLASLLQSRGDPSTAEALLADLPQQHWPTESPRKPNVGQPTGRREVRITVYGRDTRRQARSLWAWLINEPGLRGRIEYGSDAASISENLINVFRVILKERSEIDALARGVVSWLHSRPESPRVALDVVGGVRLELADDNRSSPEETEKDLRDSLRRLVVL